MTEPLVSCVMPTYGRYRGTENDNLWMLEEAIAAFLLQSYKNSELIVCNDAPNQKLHYSHPRVTVLNLDERCRNISHKRQLATQHAKGEIIAEWDDDDLPMPNYLESAVSFLQAEQADIVLPWSWLYREGDEPTGIRNLGDWFRPGWWTGQLQPSAEELANQAKLLCWYGVGDRLVMRRDAWERTGYTTRAGWESAVLAIHCVAQGGRVLRNPAPPTYFQRRQLAANQRHLSRVSWEEIGRTVEQYPCDHLLTPHWREDYSEVIESLVPLRPDRWEMPQEAYNAIDSLAVQGAKEIAINL